MKISTFFMKLHNTELNDTAIEPLKREGAGCRRKLSSRFPIIRLVTIIITPVDDILNRQQQLQQQQQLNPHFLYTLLLLRFSFCLCPPPRCSVLLYVFLDFELHFVALSLRCLEYYFNNLSIDYPKQSDMQMFCPIARWLMKTFGDEYLMILLAWLTRITNHWGVCVCVRENVWCHIDALIW